MAEEKTKNNHDTPSPKRNSDHGTTPTRNESSPIQSIKSNPSDKDRSSPKTLIEQTGIVKFNAEAFLKKIENLLLVVIEY